MRRFIAAAVLCALAVPAASFADTGPSADAVLAAAASALGASNLAAVPSLHVVATGTTLGLPATSDAYVDLVHHTYAEYGKAGGMAADDGFDGTEAWSRDGSGVVWVEGNAQVADAARNEGFRRSYALFAPGHGGATVSLLAAQHEGTRDFDVVHVEVPNSSVPFDVWIDRSTHLPDRYVETADAVTTTAALSDYRLVGGVRFPFGVRAAATDGNGSTLHATAADVSPPHLADLLREPASNPHDFGIAGASSTTVPFELVDNHVYLDVMLDGKGPFRFIFDTGGRNVVDPAVARELGASASGSLQGTGVGAATETMSFSHVASLRVGAAELHDQTFIVLPVRAGFGVAGSAPADGLIGEEVLARFVTTFDYAKRVVTLALPGATQPDGRVPLAFDGTTPLVACAIDGIASRCTLDTGSRSSLDLYAPFVAAHPSVVPSNATAPGINGFGVGGGDVGRLGRVDSLELGGFVLRNQIAGFSAATAGAFASPGKAANVGAGVLRRFTATFDYANRTLSLVPNAGFDARDVYNDRSGLFLISRGGIVAAGVRQGTPAAAAGIVAGDTFEAVGDLRGTALTLGAARAALAAPSGTAVTLRVRGPHDAAVHTVTLTLRDYV